MKTEHDEALVERALGAALEAEGYELRQDDDRLFGDRYAGGLLQHLNITKLARAALDALPARDEAVPASGGVDLRERLLAAHDRFALLDGIDNDDLCTVLDAANSMADPADEDDAVARRHAADFFDSSTPAESAGDGVVAWRWKIDARDVWTVGKDKPHEGSLRAGGLVEPLFASPSPAPETREAMDLNIAARRMQRQHGATGSEEEIEETLAAAIRARGR